VILIRDIRLEDLNGLLKLARHLNSYNLPADPVRLKALIRASVASFAGRVGNAGARRYLFVAEDTAVRRLAGCSLVLARHGTPGLPHLSFRVGQHAKHSRTLHKTVWHRTLALHADRRGFTEIGGLVVLPEYRGTEERVGRKLSYVRFTFMARHRALFRPRVLVEYLPKLDPQTGNKLWEYLGKHFTGLSYREADALSASNKEFILSLFPKERIYCSTLPYSALRPLSTMAPGARASLRLLRRMSFRYSNHVDPFDGGPHYTARLEAIPLVRATRTLLYDGTTRPGRGELFPAMVLAERRGVVRAVETVCLREGARARLPVRAARLLGLSGRERLSVTDLRCLDRR